MWSLPHIRKERPGGQYRSLVRLFLAAASFLSLAPAHIGSGDSVQARNTESVIESITPELPSGVKISIVGFDTFVRVESQGHEVLVEGYEEEPYLRISRDGRVEVNDSSMTTVLNSDRYANVDLSTFATSDVPKWRTISTDGTAMWHDHRSHWMSPKPPAVIDEKGTVLTWTIPVTVDGKVSQVKGSLYLRGEASKLWWALAVLAVIASVVLAMTRRRLILPLLMAVSFLGMIVGAMEFAGLTGEARITPVLLLFSAGAFVVGAINLLVRRLTSNADYEDALNVGVGAMMLVGMWLCIDQVSTAYVPGLDSPWMARGVLTVMAGVGISAVVNGVLRIARIND